MRRHPRGAAGGFTLVEILIVVVVIAITVALVTVRFQSDTGRALEDDARRLALLLEQARTDAATGGESLSWTADGEGYRFWRKDAAGRWQALEDEALRPRRLHPGGRVTGLRIQGQVGERLVFTPGGFGLPFEISLDLGGEQARLFGDALGNVEVRRAAAGSAPAAAGHGAPG